MMDIQEQRQGHVIILKPVGRLDSLTCREFETRLLAALDDSKTVAVDCTEMEYISSAGLRVLLVATKHNKGGGNRLALAALRDNPREVFDICGFAAIFAIYPTVAAAVAALS